MIKEEKQMNDKELYTNYTLEELEWLAENGKRAIIHNGCIAGWETDKCADGKN